jgi:uncharacterized protein
MRLDGFSDLFGVNRWSGSVFPGMGTKSNMSCYWGAVATAIDYEQLYIHNGIAATIVDRPSDDCFAKGFEIEGDDDDLMEDELNRLSVEATCADALRWARLFGASAIAVMAKDGGDWSEPLNLDTLDVVEDLIVYDNRHIKPTDRLYTDPTNPMFGKPEWFRINPPGGESFDIHETRLIPFAGEPMPKSIQHRSSVWWLGKSVLDSCRSDLDRYDDALKWTAKLLERKQQGIYKMEGLGELFAQNMDELVAKRINNIDLVRNNLNSIVVDGADDYTVENLGLDNLQNVLMEFETAICASSQMPATILFGKSASSLNATGSGELEGYYGLVHRIQTRVAEPGLERLVAILWMQRELKSKIPDDWEIEWEPLWEPTALEQAQTDFQEAQAASTTVTMFVSLMDAGILLPEEVRKIVIDKYASDYDLPDKPASLGGDAPYARSTGGNTPDGDTTAPGNTPPANGGPNA